MSEFYDLNELLAFCLRKIKVAVAIILVAILGFCGMRLVDMVPQYLSQSQEEEQTQSVAVSEEPMWSEATYLLKIEVPDAADAEEAANRKQDIISAFNANKYNSEVVNKLVEDFYSLEEKENDSRKEEFYSFGYILDKERQYQYSLYDFYSQMLVNSVYQNVQSGNYVSVGFKSTNEELALSIAEEYVGLLTNKVIAQKGEFTCEQVDRQVVYSLPKTSTGASPVRGTALAVSTNKGITLKDIIKQEIKGVIWGILLGIMASAIVLVAWYYVGTKVQKRSDLKKIGAEYLGLYTNKKKRGIFYRLVYGIEGDSRIFDEDGLAKVVASLTDAKGIEGEVLVSGTCDYKIVERACEAIEKEKSTDLAFIPSESILTHEETIERCKQIKQVILIEKIGASNKQDVSSEVKRFEELGVQIIGIALNEQ